jgi:hypothetical protein
MELSEYVTMLREELASIIQVASDEVARAADLMARALEPSVRLTMLALLSDAAAEVTAHLENAVVEVRLTGGQPAFVIQHVDPARAEPAATAPGTEEPDDAGVARVTLRLSEGLKSHIETQAAAEGVSVNTWLVNAARQALGASSGRTTSAFRVGPGRRMTGFARS